ncbi:hypothetical protein [Flavobacterium psychrotrophum]|uniref:hypothetical protein n=1 Tax=Flavobacterium psychrotrophum TaxID=2294119 RepID=UPI000E31872C|nr:hypothetical protein [Flavobacterium psychrotrophum]
MTFPELINYFREEDGTYESFCKMQRLDGDAESVEIYMPKPFGLNSKLEFFKTDETGGKPQYSYNGSAFYNLFNFYYFLNALKESERDDNKVVSDIDLTLRLLDYAERNS